jgi:hypothetical protein
MAYNPPAASAVESAEQPIQTLIGGGFGAVSKSLEGVSTWQIVLTILVLSITYDQGTSLRKKLYRGCSEV